MKLPPVNARILGVSLLCFAAALAAQAPHPAEFEVASIKPTNIAPGRDGYSGGYCRGIDTKPGTYPRLAAPAPLGQCVFTSVYVPYVIRVAYGEDLAFPAVPDMTKRVPAWTNSQRFNIVAKAPDPATTTGKQLREMLKTLLADRFKLKVHLETADLQGYGLYVAKNGARLRESTGEGVPRIYGAQAAAPELMLTVGEHASTRGLAATLTGFGLGPVVDRTGLQGAFDFRLTFDRESIRSVKGEAAPPLPVNGDGSAPSLFVALEEQLGLRLVRERIRVEYVVVDAVERPSDN